MTGSIWPTWQQRRRAMWSSLALAVGMTVASIVIVARFVTAHDTVHGRGHAGQTITVTGPRPQGGDLLVLVRPYRAQPITDPQPGSYRDPAHPAPVTGPLLQPCTVSSRGRYHFWRDGEAEEIRGQTWQRLGEADAGEWAPGDTVTCADPTVTEVLLYEPVRAARAPLLFFPVMLWFPWLWVLGLYLSTRNNRPPSPSRPPGPPMAAPRWGAGPRA